MEFIYTPMPAGAADLLHEQLPRILTGPAAEHHGKDGAVQSLDNIQFSEDPHRIYQMGHDQIIDDRPVSQAQFVMYRFLVYDAEDVIGLAMVVPDGDGLAFAGMTSGPTANATVSAYFVAMLEPDTERKHEKFEPCGLTVPSLPLSLFWLRGERRNLFVPLYDYPEHDLSKTRVYSWDEIVVRLKEHAHSVREHGSHDLPGASLDD